MGQRRAALMKTRTHFAHTIDMLDAAGEIQEHLAGVEDYLRRSRMARGNSAMAESDHHSAAGCAGRA